MILRHGHRTAEVRLHHNPKDLGQDHRGGRVVVPDHDVSDEPEEDTSHHVEDVVPDGIGADHAGDEDQGNQEAAVNIDDLGEEPGKGEPQDHEYHVRRDHAGEHLMNQVKVIPEEQRPRLEIVDGQGAHENRGGRIAR